MSIILNKYRNSVDYVWYNSSNIECTRYLNTGERGVLEVTFKKNGTTYRYDDVLVEDYVFLKNSQSVGSEFQRSFKKKYVGVLLTNVDGSPVNRVNENEVLKLKFQSLSDERDRQYSMKVDYPKQEFALFEGEEVLYVGNFNGVSIFNLFKSMDIPFVEERVEDLSNYYPKL